MIKIMSVTKFQSLADNYFSTLNPIAEKISIDIAATKDAYEDLWNTLSYKEQNKIIDETIIHPKVVLKYSFTDRCEQNVNYIYSSCFNLGEKFGELTWHDEHSAPFSWMTRSQLDLKVFCEHEAIHSFDEIHGYVPDDQKNVTVLSSKESFIDPPGIVLGGSTSKFANSTASEDKYTIKSTGVDERTLFEKLKSSTAAIIKSQTIKSALNKAGIESSHKKCAVYENDILLKSRNKCTVVPSSKMSKSGTAKQVISKPKSPPPPPPSKSKCSVAENCQNYSETKALLHETSHVSSKNLCSKADVMLNRGERFENVESDNSAQSVDVSVPKTGFDFLDNW